MDNTNRGTTFYLVGTLIMFGLLVVVGTQVVLPYLRGNRNVNTTQNLTRPSMSIDQELKYKATVETSLGSFAVELCAKCAPQNTNNFIYLSKNNYYNDTKFHLIAKDLLIQGGDINTLGTDTSTYGRGRTNYLIEDEVNWDGIGLSQEKKDSLTSLGFKSNNSLQALPLGQYSFALANDGPNTNSAQFFILTAPNSDSRIENLQGRFTVIGSISSGFDTIQKINNAPILDQNSFLPATSITIKSITISQE